MGFGMKSPFIYIYIYNIVYICFQNIWPNYFPSFEDRFSERRRTRYLYQMVAQYMMRTYNKSNRENLIKGFDLIKALIYIDRSVNFTFILRQIIFFFFTLAQPVLSYYIIQLPRRRREISNFTEMLTRENLKKQRGTTRQYTCR